jgi:hypothetical protein
MSELYKLTNIITVVEGKLAMVILKEILNY